MFDYLRRIASSPKLPDPRKRRVVIALHVVARVVLFPFWLWWRRRRPLSRKLGPEPRILLMRVDGIGDFIMTTGLLPALRSAYPAAKIDLLCSTAALGLAELFVRSRDLDELHPLPLKGVRPGHATRIVRQLRANRYDVAVDLRGDFRNVILAWLSGAPRRYGLPYSGLQFLLTEQAPGWRLMHQAEEVAVLGGMLGLPATPRRPMLPLSAEQRAAALDWLAARGAGDRPVAALHMSAFQPAKLWPIDRFREVAGHLRAVHGCRILILGSADDRPAAEAFSASLPEPALVAAGEASLVQTAALLAACRVFVGNDSGPAHIASAVGCPLVVLFGPADPLVMRPYTPLARVMKSPRPCDRRCNHKTCAVPERHCLADISVESVCAAVDELMNAHASAQAAGAEHVPGAAAVRLAVLSNSAPVGTSAADVPTRRGT